jgi:hypothetical protein
MKYKSKALTVLGILAVIILVYYLYIQYEDEIVGILGDCLHDWCRFFDLFLTG